MKQLIKNIATFAEGFLKGSVTGAALLVILGFLGFVLPDPLPRLRRIAGS